MDGLRIYSYEEPTIGHGSQGVAFVVIAESREEADAAIINAAVRDSFNREIDPTTQDVKEFAIERGTILSARDYYGPTIEQEAK